MGRRAKIDRQSISESAMRLVAQSGPHGATMRAISADMNVNEAALYRHYKSKDEMLWSAYVRIVEEMAREKQHLANADIPFREVLREWTRLTYAYFDANADAFAYVLLLPPPRDNNATAITQEQGKIFLSLIRRAIRNKEMAVIEPKLAYSHFSGMMLNVPRLIREGTLRGPAKRYVNTVADAAWRVLQPTGLYGRITVSSS